MVEMLPPAEERQWVLDSLAGLCQQVGWEPLVCAPSILPEPRFFPDTWTPDARGVIGLAYRFLRYYGMDGVEAALRVFEDEQEAGPLAADGLAAQSVRHQGAAAYFAGIVDDTCLFGINESQLSDALGVTACMAHEVAHAFRTRFRLALAGEQQRDEEERLTDLTTVFLGAGVLTTNATARHRSGRLDGSMFGHQWSFQSLGYLSPACMSFALAVVAVVRRLERPERRAIAAALEPNQAASFRKSVTWLERHQPDLGGRFGVPRDMSDWPEPWSLSQLTGTIAALAEIDFDPGTPAEDEQRWNIGKPVFRVLPGYERANAIWIGFFSFIFTVISGVWLPIWACLIVWVALIVTMLRLLRRFGRPRCSDMECRQVLRETPSICSGCGGSIKGAIRGRGRRLAAEDALDG